VEEVGVKIKRLQVSRLKIAGWGVKIKRFQVAGWLVKD
jgi:hypothetical protein